MLIGITTAAKSAEVMAKPWTPEVSVAVTYYGYLYRSGKVDIAPDRKHFAVSSWRGDLASDSTIFRLEVFAVSDLRQAFATGKRPAAKAVAEMGTASNHWGISQTRWIDGGRAIAFLGASGQGHPQVHRLDLESGRLYQLSDAPLGVGAFDMAGDALVYLARVSLLPSTLPTLYPAQYDPPMNVFLAKADPGFGVGEGLWATFVKREGATPAEVGSVRRVTTTSWELGLPLADFWISPDRRWAIAHVPVVAGSAAATWGGSQVSREVKFRNEYVLIDLHEGRMRSVLNAPTGDAVGHPGIRQALWDPTSERVILTNTLLPETSTASELHRASATIEYYIATDRFTVIESVPALSQGASWKEYLDYFERQIASIQWSHPGQTLLAEQRKGITRIFDRRRDSWSVRSEPARRPNPSGEHGGDLPGGYSVAIEEDRNTPPRIVVRKKGRQLILSATDPALADVEIARVEEFSWTDDAGHRWTGALSLPPGATHTSLPLVVQAYVPPPDRFLPDGFTTTAYARQSLNARGFAVLEMSLSPDEDTSTTVREEGEHFVAGLDAAVEALVKRGLVDPARVGLMGYSRGGWMTRYAIANPGRTRLAAAHAADGWGASYSQFAKTWRNPLQWREWISLYDGMFWDNPQGWLSREPSFKAHLIETPLLISEHRDIQDYELFGALRMQGRAAELLILPSGHHNLMRPKERVASMSATVDWMAFWLRGDEDPDVHKAERYLRWRSLRQTHCSSLVVAAYYCQFTQEASSH